MEEVLQRWAQGGKLWGFTPSYLSTLALSPAINKVGYFCSDLEITSRLLIQPTRMAHPE